MHKYKYSKTFINNNRIELQHIDNKYIAEVCDNNSAVGSEDIYHHTGCEFM